MILNGCDSVWWWMWPNIGGFNGLLRPTLEAYPAALEIAEDTKAVRDGLGTLLLHSQMQDDGIAMLYSMPSVYAVRVESGPSYGISCERHHVGWHKAIRELGLQFRYMTDRMLRLGEFDAKRFKVLVLSRAEALGQEEPKVIRQFVESGGTIFPTCGRASSMVTASRCVLYRSMICSASLDMPGPRRLRWGRRKLVKMKQL